MTRKKRDALVATRTVMAILKEIDRRSKAAAALGFSGSYTAALTDLAGWLEGTHVEELS